MLSIGNHCMILTVTPDYGARVMTLTDRNSGRQWLVTGRHSPQTGEDAVCSAEKAVGWDECFLNHPDRDLSALGPISEGFALKVYAETLGHASTAIVGPNGGLGLTWDDAPAFGLWLCYGGWPKGKPVHQVALEPATSAADHLAAAEKMGQARVLGPNETHKWSVSLSLTVPEERKG